MKSVFRFLLSTIIIFIQCSYPGNKNTQGLFPTVIPSKIDSISTCREVEEIINKLYDTLYRSEFKCLDPAHIHEFDRKFNHQCRLLADSLHSRRAFYKVDFDGNGYTDLLAIGRTGRWFNIPIVMNMGQDSLHLMELNRSFFSRCSWPVMDTIGNKPVIRYYEWKIYETKDGFKEKLTLDTLIYRFGGFVEYNPNPKKYHIKEIDFYAGPCYGSCPIFHLKINENGEATLEALEYNKNIATGQEMKGIFQTRLKNEDYQRIKDLLNYLDFPHLKKHYAVNWTDDQFVELRIFYEDENGKEKQKRINDYGKIGTHGLKLLYSLLFQLRNNQKWKKTGELPPEYMW